MTDRSRSLLALVATVALCSTLTACSGAPNDDDLHAALVQSVNATHDQQEKAMKTFVGDNQQVRNMFNEQRQADLKKVDGMRIVGCKSAEAGGYRCDVSHDGQVENIRMVKDNGVWAVVKE